MGFDVGCNFCVLQLDGRSVVWLTNYNFKLWKMITQMKRIARSFKLKNNYIYNHW